MAADFVDEYSMLAEMSNKEAFEPRSLTKAKCHPDWLLWEKAIKEELETLWIAGTWELTQASPEANIVGSKWVFQAKKDATGNIICYKACLIAQGFSQVPGIDYFDTIAPVAKLALIYAILAISAAENMEMHQIDIKGAYLNGILTDHKVIHATATWLSQPIPTQTCMSPLKDPLWSKTIWKTMVSAVSWNHDDSPEIFQEQCWSSSVFFIATKNHWWLCWCMLMIAPSLPCHWPWSKISKPQFPNMWK